MGIFSAEHKRESGENPERSGHCMQGVILYGTIAQMLCEKEKENDDL